jgi:dihydrodipicolinate synthase/N-acetylneuraminate lyase
VQGALSSPANQFYIQLNQLIEAGEQGKYEEVEQLYRQLHKLLASLEHSHKISDMEYIRMQGLLEERYRRFARKR